MAGPTATEPSRFLPYLVAAAFFMQLLDATILNTALPSIAADFHCDPLGLHGVVISYLLVVAILIPASGWISDWLGSRKVFIAAIALFCLGSLLCACSRSVNELVLSRMVQGVGGAFLMPVGRLVILRAYSRKKFVKVFSLVTIPGLLGPLFGPILGGFLVEYATWHWIFLINIPVGVAGLLVACRVMPNLTAVEKSRFDFFGFFLFAGFAVLMTLGLERNGNSSGYRTLFLLLSGAMCLVVYGIHALRRADALFSRDLFRTRNFSTGIAGNLVSRLGGGALPYLLPLFFQVVLGYSAFHSGLSLLPLALSGIGAKFLAEPLLNRYGYRNVTVINTLLIGIFMCGFMLIGKGSHSQTGMIVLLTLLGATNSLQFTCMNTLTLIDLPDKDASSGNSLLSVIMQLSVSTSIALATLLLSVFMGRTAPATDAQLEQAFHFTFAVVGGISALSALVFSRVPGDKGRKSRKKPVRREGVGAASNC